MSGRRRSVAGLGNNPGVECGTNTLRDVGDFAALLAAVGAFIAVYFASRSAAAATRSADAQTRPLLSDVPREHYLDQEREMILPGGEISRTAISGDIRADHEQGWISLPIRNTGKGLALIRAVRFTIPGIGSPRDAGPGAARRSQVQPGEEVRVTVWLSAVDEDRPKLAEAIATMEPIVVEIEYTDLAGRQVQSSHLQLGPLPGDTAWRVTDLWTTE
jgi:hypothetical protein